MGNNLTLGMAINGGSLAVFCYCVIITMQRECAHSDTSLFTRIMLGLIGAASFAGAAESVVLLNQPTFGSVIVHAALAAYAFVRVLWPALLPRLGGRVRD